MTNLDLSFWDEEGRILARQPVKYPRKQRTREHVLADLSANQVEKYALRCGYAVDRVWHDYGLDLAVFTFDGQGYLESGVLWMQLKATDHLKKTSDGNAVLIRVERRDVLAWIAEVYPVILVVYDGARDRAYWLWVQGYFADKQVFGKLRGKTITLSVPIANVLTERAMRFFARQKAALLVSPGE